MARGGKSFAVVAAALAAACGIEFSRGDVASPQESAADIAIIAQPGDLSARDPCVRLVDGERRARIIFRMGTQPEAAAVDC